MAAKNFIENALGLVGLILAEAWVLDGWHKGTLEYEPVIVFVAIFGGLLLKEPVKAILLHKKTSTSENNYTAPSPHDLDLFEEFQKSLPYDETVRYFKEVDMAGDILTRHIHTIFDYNHYWDNPNKIFIDTEVKTAHTKFNETSLKFGSNIAKYTVPLNNRDYSSTYDDNARNRGPRSAMVIEEGKILNSLASDFYSDYLNFIKLAKKKLIENNSK